MAARLEEAGASLPSADELPRGALLGVVRVDAVEPPLERDDGWALAGKLRWRLSDARLLPRPIPCAGQVGLWKVPAEHEAALRELLPDVSAEDRGRARGAPANCRACPSSPPTLPSPPCPLPPPPPLPHLALPPSSLLPPSLPPS